MMMPSPTPSSASPSLFDHLRQRLADTHNSGEHACAIDMRAGQSDLTPTTIHPAAVLIAITDEAEPSVILTRRAQHLRQHAGQVALPGGRIDAGESVIEAALREADEELSLPPSAAKIIGQTEEFITGTGYAITPVLAVIPAGLPLKPNPAEVAEWFAPSLRHMLNPANHARKTRIFRGQERPNIEILWNDHVIWGVTGAIFAHLSSRLNWAVDGASFGHETGNG